MNPTSDPFSLVYVRLKRKEDWAIEELLLISEDVCWTKSLFQFLRD